MQLPIQREEQALKRLQQAQESEQILDRNVSEIDLRLSDRIRVKMANDSPLKGKKKGK